MRLYHFLNAQHGMDDIRRRRIKIATLNELNDPFELLALNLADAELRHAFRATKDELAKRRGMLCFSRNWHNPVQWSHYSDRHRGICLGFEVSDGFTKEVLYTRKRIPVSKETLKNSNRSAILSMEAALSTKFTHWRYENEVRVFVDLIERDSETGLWFMDFCSDIELKEVIVGPECNVTRSELSDAIGDLRNSVSIKKARLSFRQFAVVTQQKATLWR